VKIVLPDPALVLLVGPSGAGKSTFAAARFAATEVVSSDAIRAAVSDDAGDQAASAEAFQVLGIIVNGRLRRRLMTVVDATNLRATNRRRYHRLAARYGIPTVAIAFDLTLDDYNERNSRRADRTVEAGVVADQAARMADALNDLAEETYTAVFVLRASDLATEIEVERVRSR
jgi:predicted kinase